MRGGIGGDPSIAFQVAKVRLERLGRVQGNGVDTCQSGRQWSALQTSRLVDMIRTFAIRALRSERTRNLNLSNSVCTMTSLKFAEGSAVAFIVSMASILKVAISMRLSNSRQRSAAYLFSHSLHRPIHQVRWIGQQLWCRPLVDPCSRESL